PCLPETYVSPLSATAPSLTLSLPAALPISPSSTPSTTGTVLSITKLTVVLLPASSVTTSSYSPSSVIGVPETYGSPFSVAVPSLNVGVTSSLQYAPSSIPSTTVTALSMVKDTVVLLPASSL